MHLKNVISLFMILFMLMSGTTDAVSPKRPIVVLLPGAAAAVPVRAAAAVWNKKDD